MESQRARSGHIRDISKEPNFEETSKTEGKLKSGGRESAVEWPKEFSQKSNFRSATMTHGKTPTEENGQEFNAGEEGAL